MHVFNACDAFASTQHAVLCPMEAKLKLAAKNEVTSC